MFRRPSDREKLLAVDSGGAAAVYPLDELCPPHIATSQQETNATMETGAHRRNAAGEYGPWFHLCMFG